MKYWYAALLCLSFVSLPAQELRVTEGITDNQVLQRSADQTADLHFGGTIIGKKATGKDVEARLTSGGSPVSGFEWMAVGKVNKLQKWTAEIKGVHTGGPYRLEVRLQGSPIIYPVDKIMVGDLWILAGQSNMEGYGDLVDVQQPIPQVHSFDMSDKWLIAEEPLHTLVSAEDRVHWRLNDQKEPERWSGERLDKYITQRKKGAGLGLPFAVEMFRRTGVPIGVIPCAHGGTIMEQWSPTLKDREGDSLYGSMLRRFHAVGGNVKGMLWYQGESDASPAEAPYFLRRFEDFVKAVRADFNEPDLPLYYVQIGRHISNMNIAEWNNIQAMQLKAETDLPNVGMISSIDCTLDDAIHTSTQDLKRLGFRLADRVCRDLFPRVKNYGDLKPGPRPVSAHRDGEVIKVNFSGVNGRLQSDGRIAGFTIHDAKGVPVPLIYKASVDPAEASTVLLYIQGALPAKATIRYGYGKDPYCNVRDAADMAVPAFGPLNIE
ncbi:MAG TPA: sialate O-acetylesterase [Bryobacteraceae bacterium]|nr:sialate O-acetylesterase [Bryobacteraceae bacterium]